MKKYLIGLILLLSLIMLGACSSESGGKSKSKDGKDLEKITVMLDWYPNAIHSFLYVAQEKGYFKDEGLDVEFQFPANPTDPINLAAAGKVTMGFYYQPDVIMAKANEDLPIKSIASIVQEPLNHVVYRSDDPVKSPKELEGKKVGFPGIPINEALVKTIVESDGGDYDKVKMVDVGFDLGQALIAKQAVAVSGMFVNHEVPLLRHDGHEVEYFNPVDYGVPSYYEVVAVTSDDTLKKQEKEIKAFWKAAKKGFDFMDDDSDAALQILLDNQNKENFPLDKAVEKDSMKILLPKMTSEGEFGLQKKESWEETAEWLKETDLIKEIPNLDEIFVNIVE